MKREQLSRPRAQELLAVIGHTPLVELRLVPEVGRHEQEAGAPLAGMRPAAIAAGRRRKDDWYGVYGLEAAA